MRCYTAHSTLWSVSFSALSLMLLCSVLTSFVHFHGNILFRVKGLFCCFILDKLDLFLVRLLISDDHAGHTHSPEKPFSSYVSDMR